MPNHFFDITPNPANPNSAIGMDRLWKVVGEEFSSFAEGILRGA